MKSFVKISVVAAFLLALTVAGFAQAKKTGVLDTAEVKQVAPTTFFYDGQVAPVQMRNTVAIRLADGNVIEAGLVDNSGYSSDVAAKYQGFFITEKNITIDGTKLGPGQYGFGYMKGKFIITDVAGSDVISVDYKEDEALKRPVPLKAVEEGGDYRLYAGKKYVTIHVE